MQFNRFIFDNYLATEEGIDALKFFSDFENVIKERKKTAYFSFLCHVSIFPVEKLLSDNELKRFSEAFDYFDFSQINSSCEKIFVESGIEGVVEDRKSFIENEIAGNENATERLYMTFVRSFSIEFYFSFPQFFFPYYFETQFPKLENICKEFDISLPPLPTKRDYKKRLFYYFEICKAFYDFRQQHELTPEEFCVFLYYFAPHCCEPMLFSENLPAPSKVYICGASKEDAKWLEDADDKTIER